MAVHKIDGVSGVDHFPTKFIELYAAAATTDGDWAAIDLGDTTNTLGASVEQGTAAAETLWFGVFGRTTAAGLPARVQIAGRRAGANVDSTVVAGDRLVSGANAGRAIEIESARVVNATVNQANVMIALNFQPVGIALGAAVTLTAPVLITDQGYFG